jgi:hypothetical protein
MAALHYATYFDVAPVLSKLLHKTKVNWANWKIWVRGKSLVHLNKGIFQILKIPLFKKLPAPAGIIIFFCIRALTWTLTVWSMKMGQLCT